MKQRGRKPYTAASEKIMAIFDTKETTSISDILVLTQLNRNTVKKHLAKLVKKGSIIQHGISRATYYTKAN